MSGRPGQVRVRHRVRVRRFRWRRWVLGGIAVVLVLGVLAVIPALGARARLSEARASMEEGRRATLAGDLDRAQEAFSAAESAFIRAEGQAGNPLLRAMSFLPIAGRTPRTVGAMAESGTLVARAGRVAASAVSELPDGLATLAPEGGAVPVQPLESLTDPLHQAAQLVERASEVFDRAPARLLVGPVAEARELFAGALEEARGVVLPAAALARSLPVFLGGEGWRTYFFGAQDPAELRGTGGLIGAYSTMRAEEGRVRFSRFQQVAALGRSGGGVEPPDPDFEARYAQFGALEVWENINMTPDFPSAAVAMARLYEDRTGRPLDGVVIADPEALEGLLRVTGPVEVPLTGDTIDEENAVDYLTNEAFSRFPSATVRKRLLGEASRVVFNRFLAGAARGSPLEAARAMISVAAEGHLLMYATDPELQRDLERAGVAGSLPGGREDFLAVVANNAAGNKIDYYADREVAYRVELGEDGTGEAEARVVLRNEAPRRGQPPYVVGPFSERFRAGENVTYLSVYCAVGCGLERFERGGARETVASERELGRPVFSTTVAVERGATETLGYRWSLPNAWDGSDGRGRYVLTFRGQPTIRPTPGRVEVVIPEGMRIAGVSDGMRVEGNRAVWEGTSSNLMRFRVEFDRPAPSRVWRAILRFLNRPLITF